MVEYGRKKRVNLIHETNGVAWICQGNCLGIPGERGSDPETRLLAKARGTAR